MKNHSEKQVSNLEIMKKIWKTLLKKSYNIQKKFTIYVKFQQKIKTSHVIGEDD